MELNLFTDLLNAPSKMAGGLKIVNLSKAACETTITEKKAVPPKSAVI
jgi:hypothetical protein